MGLNPRKNEFQGSYSKVSNAKITVLEELELSPTPRFQGPAKDWPAAGRLRAALMYVLVSIKGSHLHTDFTPIVTLVLSECLLYLSDI